MHVQSDFWSTIIKMLKVKQPTVCLSSEDHCCNTPLTCATEKKKFDFQNFGSLQAPFLGQECFLFIYILQ